ncbi:MAG: lipid-A-disaccharide synthase [Deltaproteobacteria bacterium]|jgi:lipid-A-disaccharide synthase|nr:lipid-A-disaccharide synthase [Deltaproteobacteria bacterium]
MKVLISAGEASGDLHGAALANLAKSLAPEMEFCGLGGDLMAAAGVKLLAHLSETAVMGLTEVLGSLPRILKTRQKMARALLTEKPKALILIDSPDFNFYLAKKAYNLGVPVIYYICPQIWAWRSSRIKFLAHYCARRAVILPFESDFYQKHGVSVDLVGHPLLDGLKPIGQEAAKKELGFAPNKPVLAILPGSRKALAKRLIAPMLGAAEILLKDWPDLILALPRAQSLDADFLKAAISKAPPSVLANLQVFDGQAPTVLEAADAALLASGTSTVEGTILGTPMVVAYKTSWLTYFLAKRLVKVSHISIANLLVGRQILPELIQDRATPLLMAEALRPLLTKGPVRDQALTDLKTAKNALGQSGASEKVLRLTLAEIEKAQKALKP